MISNNKNQSSSIKKKRRKLIKSCLYCRTKKLKCDRKKPKCSSCISRNLTECLYLDKNKSVSNHSIVQIKEDLIPQQSVNTTASFNNTTSGSNSYLSSSNFNKKQNKQEEPNPDTLCTKSIGNSFPDTTTIMDSNHKNPLYILECISAKKTRVMYYGPTSVRSILTNMCFTTFPPFFKVVKEFKRFRKSEKSKTNFTMMKELLSLDADRHGTVFQEIVEILPDFNTFRTCVEYYFDTLYYKFFPILHKKVVLQYLDAVLITDKEKNKILGFNHPDRRNYYPAAILLSLFSITHYSTDIPDILFKWFVYLEGCSTTKSLTFERAQFLLLEVTYRLYNGFTGGDLTHLEISVASLCKTSMSLGLYRNYTKFYPQETLDKIGGIEIVNNIWY
ncbi:uncharacterized protein SCDLUD_001665 [Saccharomycodes ludwigii]|uniref:uncharacterized protein n=1 Tax=Saccharomycodes ludwigii TaxID=36035 RepID=UPI001E854319|nr:hypothetical protein SCDLUD_001665 [Saccharomycodes ludwigii]KAH3901881.1 hypothetical protein SCDLUD_001665 [Saccharomycodes ludwigii]